MPLTDTQIRNLKPASKDYKKADSDGLYLLMKTSGAKWWRFKYRFDRLEKLLSLGVYPEVSLNEARTARDEARRLLARGINPSEHRKANLAAREERAANSFEVIAREWYAKFEPTWVPSHGTRIIRRLERDIFPWIGGKPIADVTPPELLQVIRRIEQRGALETPWAATAECEFVSSDELFSGPREMGQAVEGEL
ncbi:integrase arm-type DNA-binding domain-containing protein [Thiorhodococcus mannitoliphagus]|uniref:Integrase arm-type DNA-binding domain-containing protein n=1 Tax=Thiorhodococcus mannitoliphagus TaxID=329406 RepID=A0A6P1DZG1_9GAMM|nr:integrase arm-type DNA-binding domain-containing protein [Thiorhodococcus mannitoliphagus]NEX20925.1 integrase arm-type DNA-binding domain-containing protein [Thiorhodococcus mannitoliphagus]